MRTADGVVRTTPRTSSTNRRLQYAARVSNKAPGITDRLAVNKSSCKPQTTDLHKSDRFESLSCAPGKVQPSACGKMQRPGVRAPNHEQ